MQRVVDDEQHTFGSLTNAAAGDDGDDDKDSTVRCVQCQCGPFDVFCTTKRDGDDDDDGQRLFALRSAFKSLSYATAAYNDDDRTIQCGPFDVFCACSKTSRISAPLPHLLPRRRPKR